MTRQPQRLADLLPAVIADLANRHHTTNGEPPPMASLTICRPDSRFMRRRYQRCPIDQCITEQVVRYELWYGPTTWCCKCGDSWSEGELSERPFQRGWRRDAIRTARRLWDEATYGPAPTLQELAPEMFAATQGGAA